MQIVPAPADKTLLFMADGMVTCWGHLGFTAKQTGRDRDSIDVVKVSPAIIAYNKSAGLAPLTCDRCPK